tara:strand:+ start:817 stop:1110 length:294 start_codon:yes stop_codon:yes gene_type:complete
MGSELVPLTHFGDWIMEKRRAGKESKYSEKYHTLLCNQLYVKADGKKVFTNEFKSTIRVCCCECAARESPMLSTWYQYQLYKCYKCDRKIIEIYHNT